MALLLAVGAAADPVSKCVELLSELEAKVTKDGEAEDQAAAAYADWCKTGAQDKGWEIKTAKSEIEDLKATIGKADSDIETLNTKLEALAASISTADADLKAAAEIRGKEAKEFAANEAELVDAIDTLERASNVLQRKLAKSELLQARVDRRDVSEIVRTLSAVIDAASLSLHDHNTLVALAQSGAASEDEAEEADVGAPAPEAYASHSGGILDVLEDLKQKAETQLQEAQREEANAKHNYELLKQSLEDQAAVDERDMKVAKGALANAAETKATATGDLAATEKVLADASSVLATMETDCAAAAEAHEASKASRAEELKALAAAKAALESMTGGAVARSYEAASFLQTVTSARLRSRTDLVNFEVVNLVRKLAKEQGSTALAQLAGRISNAVRASVASGDDPFAKVKALISEMIDRLVKEGGEEATHKAYCDKEMGETKQKLDELNYDISKMSAKMDKMSSDSAKLKSEVATLQHELAEMAKAQADADKLRQEEHASYVSTKADLEEGIRGVQLALKTLREYYATALVQQPEAATTHEKASGAASGIVGMLEVVEGDFTRNLADDELAEQQAAVAYEKFSQETRVSTVMKEKSVEYKTKEAASLDKALGELASDKDTAQSELDAVLEYTKNLRAMCVAKPESYEQRVARREAEIAGLKQALEILGSEALLQLRGRAASRHVA